MSNQGWTLSHQKVRALLQRASCSWRSALLLAATRIGSMLQRAEPVHMPQLGVDEKKDGGGGGGGGGGSTVSHGSVFQPAPLTHSPLARCNRAIYDLPAPNQPPLMRSSDTAPSVNRIPRPGCVWGLRMLCDPIYSHTTTLGMLRTYVPHSPPSQVCFDIDFESQSLKVWPLCTTDIVRLLPPVNPASLISVRSHSPDFFCLRGLRQTVR